MDAYVKQILGKYFFVVTCFLAKLKVNDLDSLKLCCGSRYEGVVVGIDSKSSIWDGITILLQLFLGAPSLKERERYKNMFVIWFVFIFRTDQKIDLRNLSMRNNGVPYPLGFGEKNLFSTTDQNITA